MVDSTGKLLGAVVLVQVVMRDLLEVGQVSVEQGVAQAAKV